MNDVDGPDDPRGFRQPLNLNKINQKTMNLPSSEQLLNDLIKSLETEIEAEEKKVNDSIFALKVKKARLKKLKGDHQRDKAPLSEDKPA